METRQVTRALCVALTLGLAACGGGDGNRDGGGSALALGKEAVVEHTQIGTGGATTKTTVGITVLEVTRGTQEELEQGGLEVDDPEERNATPYYVDVRYENQGSQPIKRDLQVGLEDQDGNLIGGTTIISFGGPPFAKCKPAEEGEVEPGESYESCKLFLVPEGKEPSRVSFLPYNPEEETEFVYWAVE
jgi:hypothetical protein